MADVAYCVKCKEKREMKDPHHITMKNGKPALQGQCPRLWNTFESYPSCGEESITFSGFITCSRSAQSSLIQQHGMGISRMPEIEPGRAEWGLCLLVQDVC